MERPQVRIVDQPQVQDVPVDVSGHEADWLLAKYGYTTGVPASTDTPAQQADGRTFDQMVREEEARRAAEAARRNRPRAVTFDDSSVRHSETRWSSMDDAPGLGIQVTIVTDMKI